MMTNGEQSPDNADRDAAIPYRLQLSARRKKSIAIQVKADGEVIVRAPRHLSRATIDRFILGKRAWVSAQLDRLAALPPRPTTTYSDGEMHHYLGRAYPLRLRIADGARRRLHFSDEALQLELPAADGARALLDTWYRQQARAVFHARLRHIAPQLPWIGNALPDMKIRAMRRQWGSCSRKGHISLNLHLIKAPVACIDYVLVHELCHLKEHNHSPRFYALMQRHLPEWKAIRRQLNDLGPSLIPT